MPDDTEKGQQSIITAQYFIEQMHSPVFLKRSVCLTNIPYKIVGGVNFYARKEIKDLLCYLKTVDNAADDLAVRRILNVPKRGIGATTVRQNPGLCDMMNISFY